MLKQKSMKTINAYISLVIIKVITYMGDRNYYSITQ